MAIRVSENEEDIHAEINITPLTDVFLVLLIIFMVTSTALNSNGVNVELPKANQQAANKPSQGVTITLTADGKVLMNSHEVPESELRDAIQKQMEVAKTKTVIFEGDTKTQLGAAVKIMDVAKSAGAEEIAIATQN